jgi:hypothetical protein
MDYNIYIHDNTSGSSSSNTEPWKTGSKQTEPWQDGSGEMKQALNAISNPDSVVASAVGGIRSFLPTIASAIAVVAVADKIITTQATWLATETGDNRQSLFMQEYHTTINNILRPYSSLVNNLRAIQNARLQNQRQEMSKMLLGDSLTGGETSV